MITLTFDQYWYEQSTPVERTAVRDLIVSALSSRTCTVKYEKKDGGLKEAKATLRPSFLPETKGEQKTQSNDNITYVDIDTFEKTDNKSTAWRSFRLEGLREFSASV